MSHSDEDFTQVPDHPLNRDGIETILVERDFETQLIARDNDQGQWKIRPFHEFDIFDRDPAKFWGNAPAQGIILKNQKGFE